MTNWRTVRLLYVHELRMLVRAGRAVLMAVVLPAVVMPLMLFAARFSVERQERSAAETTYGYAVTGAFAPELRLAIERTRSAIEAGSSEDDVNGLRELKFREKLPINPERSLEAGEIDFILRTFSGSEVDGLPELKETREAAGPLRVAGVPLIQIVHRGNVEASRMGAFGMESFLSFVRREGVKTLLVDRGFEDDPSRLFAVAGFDVATAAEKSGSGIGRFLTAILVMLMLSGGSIAAMDIVAGERERGTLETLLTTAAGRVEIVVAKLAAVSTAALVSLMIQALNFLIYIQLGIIPLPDGFALDISGGAFVALLIVAVPLGVAIGAFLLLISARAGSYKEAQMYFLPAFLLSLIPSLAATLPGLRLRSAIAFVPIANVSVAVRGF